MTTQTITSTKADLLEHYINNLRWGLAYLEGKNPQVMGESWQKRPILNPLDFPADRNIGLIHEYSKTATLDIDHPGAVTALTAVGISLDELLSQALYKIVGDVENFPKPLYRAPDIPGLKTKQLRWPDPTGELNSNGTPKLITIFELRGGEGAFQDVLPPSIHPDTKTVYTWLDGNIPPKPEDIPALPQSLLFLWQNWDSLSEKLQKACPWLPAKTQAKPAKQNGNSQGFDVTLVQTKFNEEYTPAEVLERNGYKRRGSKWLCPGSSSGNPGVIPLGPGDKVMSFHGSDPLSDGKPHDAFDCYVILEHNGDMSKAWHVAKGELGITFSENGKPKHRQASKKEIDPETGEVTEESESAGPGAIEDTYRYTIEDGQLIYHRPVQSKGEVIAFNSLVVAGLTASITEDIKAENGIRFYKVEGVTRQGQSFEFEISAEDFTNDNRLKAAISQAAGAKATIMANMAKHLGPAIQTFTNGDLRYIQRFDRTGWNGGRFLIPGRESEGVTIHLPRKLPYAVSSDGNTDKALEALDWLVKSMPLEKSTVLLSFIFQSPLAKLMRWRESDRYALFLSGQTGSFKTTYSQAAMSIYGAGFLDDTALIKWGDGATRNAIMAQATRVCDLPLLIDNYKPSTGGGELAFYALLHAICEGGEKDRLNRASELRETRPIYAWPIFTGEDTPAKDPASLSRMLKIDWSGVIAEKLTEVQNRAEYLPAIGATWLDWLESDHAKEVTHAEIHNFGDRRNHWAERVRAGDRDAQNVMRIASNLAGNELTLKILNHHPVIGRVIWDGWFKAHNTGLEEIAKGMAQATVAGVEAVRFLDALKALVISGRCILSNRGGVVLETDRDRHIGWKDADGIYLNSNLALKAALDLLGRDGLGSVSPHKLHAQLWDLGKVATRDEKAGKILVVKRCGATTERVLHLKPDALEEAEKV